MAHAHSHGGEGHERRLLLASLIIGGFMLAEVVGGIVSGSLALLADAGHMVTDFLSLGLAFLATRMAKRPADGKRSYGFGRLQVLAAFVNGLALVPIAIWIVAEAWHRINDPVPVAGGMLLAIAILGLGVNIAAFALLHGHGDDNVNIRAAAAHVMGDLLGSLAAITAGAVIIWTGWTPIDPLLSVLVALIILRSGYIVTRDAGRVLIEAAPPEIDTDEIGPALVESIDEVKGVHHVHVWMLTDSKPMATLHAQLVPDTAVARAVVAIKTLLHDRFGIEHATVEVEFETCADNHAKAHA
ncbi:MAG: cation diffusion facilitator family transporter [Tepidamorphaceae bacterium]|nr:cation diffusion facilitator family transporter [Rhodobiaceae bacterium]MCC0049952.1 cation diffusion facilitator family transporter [Rhodobiaceae bacterium]